MKKEELGVTIEEPAVANWENWLWVGVCGRLHLSHQNAAARAWPDAPTDNLGGGMCCAQSLQCGGPSMLRSYIP